MTDNLRGSLWMLLAMAGFAVEDAFFKAATGAGAVTPGSGTLLFGLLALGISAVIATVQGQPLWHRAYLERRLMIRTGFEIMGRLFFALSLAFNTLSTTSAILQAAPLVVMLGAGLILGERIGPRRWIAMAVGFFGVMLILRPTPDAFTPTTIFAVLGMLGFAGRDLATRTSPPEVHATQLNLLGFATVALAGIVLILFEPGRPALPTAQGAAMITGTALAGVMGYSALTAAMRTGEVSIVAPFRYFRLIVALAIAMTIFSERPDALTLLGAALIVGSGLYTLMRDARRKAAT
ncbi:DMT family transporter [Ponticoccus sp. SC2-23]|uniref:DMT family transporter n=1 Tax=Alexandriicola marinus TaxID=2081710 RepID=UPI000FD73507|nr:DMT family transporter [Alexandriicola marinus]MBM1221979.1 DMT family transporter [Ponticoccus sp. SC6-9]MBM1226330.1 DMT family transporter [Ponticoccus sp. SC6-15]MBM1230926.1 DMT family transporter [Ponticoccus sp. SC6-38]MBM1235233.1 DMT family transporter [Ponticoccus sp. SC6-45]MBM1239948.1 DMT family transporter [Ponticoccus sp. SC6-49]MBM1244092.1 DMT family transporter [Ponticoccus sp. SC2-64]MBM1248757.1 DMT family transporter [Ponticoccus sp. SC6-42]MBM1253603.1 DMT family tr